LVAVPVGLILVAWGSCAGLRARFYADHAAPFGRTEAEIERTLTRALPAGTSLDSTRSFLLSHDMPFSIIDSIQDQYRLIGSSFAVPGGVLLTAENSDVDFEFPCDIDAQIYIAFDAAHRVVRRFADMQRICP
jgi:hypothetical protein